MLLPLLGRLVPSTGQSHLPVLCHPAEQHLLWLSMSPCLGQDFLDSLLLWQVQCALLSLEKSGKLPTPIHTTWAGGWQGVSC